jgi:glycosyltransferase involved in cell wall biosynthesis
MTEPPPRVSVIMASYNGERFVAAAVRSLLTQTFRDLEVVIVDDGSKAPTIRILKDLAEQDARVKLHFAAHGGLVATLNSAVSHARGALVARLDHDDISLPHRLERQVAFLNSNPGHVAVGSDIGFIDANDRVTRLPKKRQAPEPHAPLGFPPKPMWIPGPSLMARTDVLRQIGGYRDKFFAAEDRDICWRLGAFGPTNRLLEVLVHWRFHGSNTTVTAHQTQMASHALGDLSAIANHLGFDDSAILADVVVGGDYLPIIHRYRTLLAGHYPVDTYWYFFLMRYRVWQLSGELTEAALMQRVWAHLRAKPLDWRRWRLARRAYMFERRDRTAIVLPDQQLGEVQ